MIEIRSNQEKLIQSEMQRNAKTKRDLMALKDEEPLNDGSTGAPWYVTQKQRKYYNLKSLDKSSFVFTRIKPKREIISQTEIERVESNDDATEIEDSVDMSEILIPEQPVPLNKPVVDQKVQPTPRKRGRQRKIKSETDPTESESVPKFRRLTRNSNRIRDN